MKTKWKKFRPWEKDYKRAALLYLGGVVWLAIGCFWAHETRATLPILISFFAVPFFFLGLEIIERANKRKHGSKVEKEATEKFLKIRPDGWISKTDVWLGGRKGNADLWIQLPNDECCVIEIKSWHDGIKGSKPIYQVRGQRKELRAHHALIWLPRSTVGPKIYTREEVWIVEGNEFVLLAALQQLNHVVYVLKFSKPPSESAREYIKKLKFRWNSAQKQWEGSCGDKDKTQLRKIIETEAGTITPA
jgi:hypothetical protein